MKLDHSHRLLCLQTVIITNVITQPYTANITWTQIIITVIKLSMTNFRHLHRAIYSNPATKPVTLIKDSFVTKMVTITTSQKVFMVTRTLIMIHESAIVASAILIINKRVILMMIIISLTNNMLTAIVMIMTFAMTRVKRVRSSYFSPKRGPMFQGHHGINAIVNVLQMPERYLSQKIWFPSCWRHFAILLVI